MERRNRYERFEAVTVRAAGRVLRVTRMLSLSEAETEYYLRELVLLDAHAPLRAHPALRRLALRRSPLGRAGTRSFAARDRVFPVPCAPRRQPARLSR